GLTGLGVSFLMVYMIYLIQVYVIAKVKYHFSFTSSFLKIFAVQFSLALMSFAIVNLIEKPYTYVIGTLLIGVSCWYSYLELESRIGLKEIIRGFLQKYRNK
ncbi:MAG TPA: O-antigen translocase, partial [Porphyromonadaceae bacterium]|nr:O-antigen translocase [Porphyromonadaceae bacterium]